MGCEYDTRLRDLALPSLYLPPITPYTFPGLNEGPVLPPLSSSALAIPTCDSHQAVSDVCRVPSPPLGPLPPRETRSPKISSSGSTPSPYITGRKPPQQRLKPSKTPPRKLSSLKVELLGSPFHKSKKDTMVWKSESSKVANKFGIREEIATENDMTKSLGERQSTLQKMSTVDCQTWPNDKSIYFSDPHNICSSPSGITVPLFTYPPSLIARMRELENIIQRRFYALEELMESNESEFKIYHNTLCQKCQSADGRIEKAVVTYFGYPLDDSDMNSYSQDAPGLASTNVEVLSKSLQANMSSIRKAAECSVGEAYRMMREQTVLRKVTISEIENCYRHIVRNFCKTRERVVSKFRCYVRNRKWIENVATRQRRGCLTHRQNNLLRLWLFRNFTNPYPGVEDKKALVEQTGLSTTQVNNWLINARSRVWKPTVDAMSWGEEARGSDLVVNQSLEDTDTSD